uniref:Reverse transcriptase Ty1/copia-type domain-containing protein n=1 Tax=Chromera velia CCMP2878 TaxID=1169474 RepID=A0A0G4GR20_9ALVE|eukprot:Cvel_5078.t1-p1 / transcript=Cvel_5078.t1 / gene=Cvel_5078 / organism=Chromera_velia_CCMP2878 / gene_product=hypothetical protein / transcript_product=hypothetical protein / location=Cvel_scaffold231:73271-75496(-) / protein_length=742 / sequence_SO=supercontig / SO=protein_coding / is_pseudo=false
MTDHGPEFQGDWYEWLAEREATNPLTPVGSHHSLDKTECSHREWLTILRGILRDRGLDDSHWKEFASLAIAKYNRQPRGSSHKSPFERRWGAQPPSPPIDALHDLLQTSHRPSAETSPFPIGLSVLYHHPDHLRTKLAPLYTPATVLQRISEHVFRLYLPSGRPILSHRRCIRPNDSPNPDPVYVVPLPLDSPLERRRADTSVGSSQQQEQQQQQSSDSPCSSAPHSSPKFDITDFGKDELILWRDENTGRCFLGSVRAVDPEGEGRVEVQAWGSNGKQPLASQRMQPVWCPFRSRPKLLYGVQKPSGCGPELCFLVPEEVVERNIVLSAEGTLPSHLCDTYQSVLLASPETVFPTDRLSFNSLASSAAAAAIFPLPPHLTPVAGASVVYLWNEDDEVGPGVFQAATTHIPLPRWGLTVEQLDGRAQSRAAELQSLADNDVYKRVPIAEVDAEHRRSAVPTHFVDTEKHVEEGAWTYKSRVVADGTPFFDRREEVTTSCATASQSAIRIALSMAFAHSDFNPREIVVADVKTAYLTALRSDSLYVHPSKDHPDHGQFLWLLNRTLYGLRDSGNLWDRSRNKTLATAGWVPFSVRGMWWKWTDKPEAPTSRLLGILPTFVADFTILPIGRSAVQLVREIAAKGGYQMKITKPKNGTLRWARVDFNVSRDSVHIHQTEYLLSLPLPESMGESEDSSASAPSSAPVPSPDLFPLPPSSRELPSEPPRLLTAQEGKAFREWLGCLS